MKRILAALALMLFAAVPARAANIRNIDLGRRAEVWFAEDHTVPVVSFNISLPAGSAYDPAGKAGLAAFTGAMIDEGAGGLDSKSFHEALANRAIAFSARAERDYLVISISTLKENAGEAMHLLQLALTHPRFENEALSRVRAQIIQSLQQEQAEPQRLASRGFAREFFGGHAYAHPITGEIDSISSITTGDLRNFARGHWVKNGLKVAVAGDITAPALTKLRRLFLAPDRRSAGQTRSDLWHFHFADRLQQGGGVAGLGCHPRQCHPPDRAGGEADHGGVRRQRPDAAGTG